MNLKTVKSVFCNHFSFTINLRKAIKRFSSLLLPSSVQFSLDNERMKKKLKLNYICPILTFTPELKPGVEIKVMNNYEKSSHFTIILFFIFLRLTTYFCHTQTDKHILECA